ncbi:MAG: hypothetical protein Q7V01_13505 [Vicinamibacterales bacterium]|nr:hypothetical protein [Vicinamibacterales bacterium]
MGLSRWWRERRFERAYRRSAAADLRRIGLAYKAKFSSAEKDGQDFDAVMNAYLAECRLPDLRLETLRSRILRRKAERFGIEMPRDWWEHDETHDLWYLTPEGRRHLRRRLTEERVWVVKQWSLVLAPVIALVIGLIGTIIGLLGIWRAP